MIICTPKGTLSAAEKQKVAKKGLILIECDDPDKIRVIDTETHVITNDWFLAALNALTVTVPSTGTQHFVNNLWDRLKEKPEEIPPQP